MSYFDDASLVMIPSGYKTSKVYSVKPTDGSGDLTFSRSNDTATRVNSAGLIEKVRTNLILQSQTFDNASWANVGTGTGLAPVVTANAGVAPDGTTTADRIVFNTGAGTTSGDRSIFRQSVSSSIDRTGSFYIKSNTGSSQTIGFHNGGQLNIVTATTSWQRFSVDIAPSVVFFGLENRGDNATAGTCDVLVWGAQLETGDIATSYIATTTAAVSVGPVANVPRLDYLNSSCPRLLLEPQRTNLVPFSDGLQVVQAFGATLTKNQITSPDGYVNASLLTPSGGAAGITLMTGSFSGNYTVSVYLKGTVAGQKVRVFGDLQGTIANFTLTTSWARYTATFNSTNATGQSMYLLAGSYFSPSENNPFYVYGAQIEAGAYATSYIPTLGAAVTRGADDASKTGISSLIGQTEGTLFCDFNVLPSTLAGSYYLETFLNDGTSNNKIAMAYYDSGRIQFAVFASGSLVVNINLPSYGLTVGKHKFALAYKLNDYVAYVDGVSVGTDTSAAVPATSDLILYGTNGGTHAVNQTLLFKTRLSNSSLAELTSL